MQHRDFDTNGAFCVFIPVITYNWLAFMVKFVYYVFAFLYLFVYILMITNRGFGYNWLVWAVEGGRLQGRLAPSGAHNQQTEPST